MSQAPGYEPGSTGTRTKQAPSEHYAPLSPVVTGCRAVERNKAKPMEIELCLVPACIAAAAQTTVACVPAIEPSFTAADAAADVPRMHPACPLCVVMPMSMPPYLSRRRSLATGLHACALALRDGGVFVI
jgi:hypothetical protein